MAAALPPDGREAWSREASAVGTRATVHGPPSTERRSAATPSGELADVRGEEEAQQETLAKDL
jgi:hypothetical protein